MRAANDTRRFLFARVPGRYWSWNEGGSYLTITKWHHGPLRIYLFGLVVCFDWASRVSISADMMREIREAQHEGFCLGQLDTYTKMLEAGKNGGSLYYEDVTGTIEMKIMLETP